MSSLLASEGLRVRLVARWVSPAVGETVGRAVVWRLGYRMGPGSEENHVSPVSHEDRMGLLSCEDFVDGVPYQEYVDAACRAETLQIYKRAQVHAHI